MASSTEQNGDRSKSRDLEADRVNLFLHAENVRVFASPQDRQLPVTIVTGFLGSGKTTLLQHILTNKSNLRIAAAINDFASLNIDENLIRHHDAQATKMSDGNKSASRIVELSNGCVCCHLLDDLKEAVWRLLDSSNNTSDLERDEVNYLVIETSGVADPLKIIRTLDAKFGKCFRARLDSVITVVDADQMLCEEIGDESDGAVGNSSAATAQLACADVVLLNKVDLLMDPKEDCQKLEERIRSINETAIVYRTTQCNIPLPAILDVQIPNNPSSSNDGPITHEKSEVLIYVSATGGTLRTMASSSSPSTFLPQSATAATKARRPIHVNASDEYVSISESITDRPLLLWKLQRFLCSNSVRRQLARMKGVLWIQGEGLGQFRCVVHLSGRGRLGFSLDGMWTGPPTSDVAFIGRTSALQSPNHLRSEFSQCCLDTGSEDPIPLGSILNDLSEHPEFVLLKSESHQNKIDNHTPTLSYFRLTGSQVYGYTEVEIVRDLRIDLDAMNRDLADAVNTSVDEPKAFLAYTIAKDNRVALCYPGVDEPANNLRVLVREAKLLLKTYFRNVKVCKCGE